MNVIDEQVPGRRLRQINPTSSTLLSALTAISSVVSDSNA